MLNPNSINHPLLRPWAWRDGATDLRYVHCLEIWNDPYWPDNAQANPQAVALWTAWLNAGYRITGIGGSDYHSPRGQEEGKGIQRLGLPSTYVFAGELSTPAILEGLKRRRAYVSMGPRVAFQARAGGRDYQVGDDLGQISGGIEFIASVAAGPAMAHACIVKNGEAVADAPVRAGLVTLRWQAVADPAGSDWYRLDVLDEDGRFLAITNPIFVGPIRTSHLHQYGDFIDLSPGAGIMSGDGNADGS